MKLPCKSCMVRYAKANVQIFVIHGMSKMENIRLWKIEEFIVNWIIIETRT